MNTRILEQLYPSIARRECNLETVFQTNFTKTIQSINFSNFDELIFNDNPEKGIELKQQRVLIRKLVSLYYWFSKDHVVVEELYISNKYLGRIRDQYLFGHLSLNRVEKELLHNNLIKIEELVAPEIDSFENFLSLCREDIKRILYVKEQTYPLIKDIHSIRKLNRSFLNLMDFLDDEEHYVAIANIHCKLGDLVDHYNKLVISEKPSHEIILSWGAIQDMLGIYSLES